MTIDAGVIGLVIGGALVGIVLDCNRRVRELQRTSDLHTRWLDAMLHHRPLDHAPTHKRNAASRRRIRA